MNKKDDQITQMQSRINFLEKELDSSCKTYLRIRQSLEESSDKAIAKSNGMYKEFHDYFRTMSVFGFIKWKINQPTYTGSRFLTQLKCRRRK